MCIAAEQTDPEWMNAHAIGKATGVLRRTLQNLVISGLVRVHVDPVVWPHQFYSLSDVRKWQSERGDKPGRPSGRFASMLRMQKTQAV